MGMMIAHHGYENGHNNPMQSAHKTMGAHYTQENTVFTVVFQLKEKYSRSKLDTFHILLQGGLSGK